MAGTPDLDELYDASYRRLVVQLYAICGDLADAEDAVQEAFVTALRKRSDLARVSQPRGLAADGGVQPAARRLAPRRRRPSLPGPGARAAAHRSRSVPSTSRS